MKILTIGNMYPPHSHGGYEVLWRDSVESLRTAGHDVRVLTTGYRAPEVSDGHSDPAHVSRLLEWYWHEHAFPKISPAAALALERRNRRRLRSALRELRPDVVAFWAMGGMSMSLIEQVRRARLPAVGVVADDWMTYGPRNDRWLTRCARRPWLFEPLSVLAGVPARVDLGRAARWLFISEYCRREAIAKAGVDLQATAIASPGVDAATFPAAPPSPWSGRLLYSGRLDERKGVADAIAALAHLPASTLRIVGGGDDKHEAELRALAASHAPGRVEFAGQLPREELASAYAQADALLFPVVWPEPWGLVPLEAMACGTPVVATGTGGSGEYLDHEHNALLVAPGSPAEIAAAVSRLQGDEELRARLRSGGLSTAATISASAYNAAIAAALAAAADARLPARRGFHLPTGLRGRTS